MRKLALETFTTLIADAPIRKRLKSELKFVTSVEHMSDENWADRELLAITDRTGTKGVLLVQLDTFYIIPYELKAGITSSTTGRSQSVICDFCRTWQYGNMAGSITFQIDKNHTISYLVCADLQCSLHVRTKTNAAHTSRAQLREDLTPEQRIERLKARLQNYINGLPVEPITY